MSSSDFGAYHIICCLFTLDVFKGSARPDLQNRYSSVFFSTSSCIYSCIHFLFYLQRSSDIHVRRYCLQPNTIMVNGILFVSLKALEYDLLKTLHQLSFNNVLLLWIIHRCQCHLWEKIYFSSGWCSQSGVTRMFFCTLIYTFCSLGLNVPYIMMHHKPSVT